MDPCRVPPASVPRGPTGAPQFTANVGDSRAVLGKKVNGKMTAVGLTEDQKPDTPAEMARILQYGGYVTPPSVKWPFLPSGRGVATIHLAEEGPLSGQGALGPL